MAAPMSPWLALVALLLTPLSMALIRSPTVDVYSARPCEIGKENTIICYVQNYHPPNVEVEILKNGVPMAVQEKDTSFGKDWSYYTMKYANITYNDGDEFGCRVKHDTGAPNVYKWEPML